MARLAVDDSGTPCIEAHASQTMVAEENDIGNRIKVSESDLQSSHDDHAAYNEGQVAESELPCQERVTGPEILDKGYLKYGGAALELPVAMKYLIAITVIMRTRSYTLSVTPNRFDKVAKIVVYVWAGTFVGFASCFMMIHLKQYHCDGCGICRIGGSENFFHCNNRGCCCPELLKSSHPSMRGESNALELSCSF